MPRSGAYWFALAVLVLCLARPAISAADESFLSEAEAPKAVFPDADRFAERSVPSTPDLRGRVAKRLGDVAPSIWEPSYRIVDAFAGERPLGRAIEVEEIGKHRAITLVIGVGTDGKVAGVAVMTYREAYGGEIRSKRFLAQYRGKSGDEPLLPSRDIQNISGATLSARAVGRAVKKAIAVLAEAGPSADAGSRIRTVAAPTPSRAPARVREAFYAMGTMLEITVDAPTRDIGRLWIRRAAAEATRLDRELSSFDPDSALTRLNGLAGRGPQDVPLDLFHVVETSASLSRATAGTFDVTVSPLVVLWNRAAELGRIPTAAEIARARERVGSGRIALRPPASIDLPAGMALELGGVGKGYAVDRMIAALGAEGAQSALVNFGGSSIAALGPPSRRKAWPVWIRRDDGRLDGPFGLRDESLSTSGSFGHFETVGGRRFGHVIDPRSGWPLQREASVTVRAPSATEAEAWSKAWLVDAAEARERLAHRPSVSVVMFSGRAEGRSARVAALEPATTPR